MEDNILYKEDKEKISGGIKESMSKIDFDVNLWQSIKDLFQNLGKKINSKISKKGKKCKKDKIDKTE